MIECASWRFVGKCVELVPYEPEHVPKYHEWMTDPHLRECTASEPLTLDEEYAMQISWREDPKKCTFIVLHRGSDDLETHTSQDAIDRMIGDVNLFFNDYEDSANCEIEIMIANESHRRQGCGREAVEIMMAFAVTRLNASRFYCKIHRNNKPSMKLFENLGYIQCNYVAAFEEYEYEFALKNNTIWKARIAQEIMQSTRVIIDSTILQEERTLKNAVTLVEAVD
ncbi:unnamed protein product [Albugo candida]|uniref:N-acetyltransferase domain-containing protein n=1 Tax=Albugo candida TaxID=65357 RepID=A0A024G2N2_9STRA|nr:unnamed protein product [Albugo candida]|eukprot:CCI40881.1 unnamed protein product [Albugo candida]